MEVAGLRVVLRLLGADVFEFVTGPVPVSPDLTIAAQPFGFAPGDEPTVWE